MALNNDRLIYLLVRKQAGEITLEEKLELSKLVKNDDGNRLLVESIEEVFESSLDYSKEIKNSSVEKALDVLHNKMQEADGVSLRKRNYRSLKFYIAAASVTLILGCAVFYLAQIAGPAFTTSDVVTTKKGSKTNLILPDGTKVWVNADTRLSYDKEFGHITREVNLVGEAYFDVTKDKNKPFIVHTSTMDVKVLGTAFNVRAYDDEVNTQTTLLRGSIEVLLKNSHNKKLVLLPNEKIVVQNDKPVPYKNQKEKVIPEMEVLKIDRSRIDSIPLETQWTHNRLVFEQETIGNIIPVLERWYNVTIQLQNIKNPDLLYRGTFENDSLEDVMESLRLIGGFKYSINKDKVVIY